jgi:hypothetical protein
VQQAPSTAIDVPASGLGRVTFVVGTVGNALQMRAFDGVSWSPSDTAAWVPFSASVNAAAAPQAQAIGTSAFFPADIGLLVQSMASTFVPPGGADSTAMLPECQGTQRNLVAPR